MRYSSLEGRRIPQHRNSQLLLKIFPSKITETKTEMKIILQNDAYKIPKVLAEIADYAFFHHEKYNFKVFCFQLI